MSLTQDEIDKYKSQFNFTKSTPPTPMVNGQSSNDRMNFFFGDQGNGQNTNPGQNPIPEALANGAATHAFNPANPDSQQNLENITKGTTTSVLGNLPAAIGEGAVNYGKSVVNDFKEGGQNISNDINRTSGSLDYNPKTQQNIGTTVLDTLGNVAKTAFSPITEAIAPVVKGDAEMLANNPTFQNIANSKVGAAVDNTQISAQQSYQKWAANNPEMAKDLESSVNIAALLGTKEVAPEIGQATSDLAKSGINTAKTGLNTAKNAISDTIESLKPTPEDIAAKQTAQLSKADVKATANTWNMVQPELSKLDMAEAVKNGDIVKDGKLGTIKQVAQGRNAEMVEAAKPYVATAKDPIEAVSNMQKGIADEANNLREGLQQSTATWSQNNLKGAINSIEKPHLLSGDLENSFNKTMNVVLDKAKTADKNLSGLLDVRQALDQEVAKQYPNLYNSDTMTPIKQAVTQTRSAINDLIENKLPEGKTADGTSFKDSLKKQSLLYNAIDNTAPKVGKIGSNAITKFMKDNPKTSKIIKYGIGAAAGGEILKHTGILP